MQAVFWRQPADLWWAEHYRRHPAGRCCQYSRRQTLLRRCCQLSRAITGSGKVIFGSSGNNFIENSSNLTGAAGTLTIGAGITVEGKTGIIYSAFTNGALLNQGTIKADVAGGTITIGSGLEPFTNANTLRVGQGALTLNGSKTLNRLRQHRSHRRYDQPGWFSRSGSLQLELECQLGNLESSRRHCQNGTIIESEGALFTAYELYRRIPQCIDGWKLGCKPYSWRQPADLWWAEHYRRHPAGRCCQYSRRQTLLRRCCQLSRRHHGSGKVIFGSSGSKLIENSSNLTGAAGTLTIGAGITVEGKTGIIYSAFTNGALLNQGTIKADVAAGLSPSGQVSSHLPTPTR